MAELTETLNVSGIRCERCVERLAVALRGREGLLEARADLVGNVTLTWDGDVTDRDALVTALSRAGFHETEPPE